MDKRVKRTEATDDLPRSPTGRVPKWVIDEAAGRQVDPSPWRAPGSPLQDPPTQQVRRRRSLWWWVAGLTAAAMIVAAVSVVLV